MKSKASFKLTIILALLFLGYCSIPSKKEDKNIKRKLLTLESYSRLKNEYVNSVNSNGYIVTFINGDCSYCTNRIPHYEHMMKKFRDVGLNSIILVYSENNFYLTDTCELRKKHESLHILFDSYNIFQIENKLPNYTKEYSIYVNNDRDIIDIGSPDEILNKYTNSGYDL